MFDESTEFYSIIALTLQILLRLFFKGAPNLFLQPGLFFKKYIYIFFLLIYLAHMILVS